MLVAITRLTVPLVAVCTIACADPSTGGVGPTDSDSTDVIDANDANDTVEDTEDPRDSSDETTSPPDTIPDTLAPTDTIADTSSPTDTSDTGDTSSPTDTSDTTVTGDTSSPTDTSDTTVTGDTSSPTDTSDTTVTGDTSSTTDTADTAGPSLPAGVVLINEVYANTNRIGTLMTHSNPYVFVELVARPGTALTGLSLVGVDSEGVDTISVSLSGAMPDDGFYVITTMNAHETIDAAADKRQNFPIQSELFSLELRQGGNVLDAIAYGEFRDGDIAAGEGDPAPSPGYHHSLARDAASTDTDDNAADFRRQRATPGAPNVAPAAPIARLSCPEETTIDTPVLIDGSASSDPDGIATWTFDLGDGRERLVGSNRSHSVSWPLASTFTVRLIATAPGIDQRPMTHEATCRVRVVAAERQSTWRTLGAGGRHTCGLRDDGTVWCWGANDLGQLGAGQPDNFALEPQRVVGDSGTAVWGDWVELAVGGRKNLGIRADGTLWQWGDGARRPTLVRGVGGGREFRDWVSISAGDNYACGIRQNGSLWCWGANTNGMLGDNSTTTSLHPVQVHETSWRDWVSVSTGEQHTCATRPGGQLYCWGRNDGALGLGDTNRRTKPTRVDTAGGWAVVSVGWSHTCALKRDRRVHCWGKSEQGQLGFSALGGIEDTPRAVTGTTWVSVEAGNNGTCGLRADQSLWCWGNSQRGQRGDGVVNAFASEGPVRVLQAGAGAGSGLVWDDWVAVWPLFGFHDLMLNRGVTHACAERSDGSTWCWGAGADGQRGDGSRGVDRSTPVEVTPPSP